MVVATANLGYYCYYHRYSYYHSIGRYRYFYICMAQKSEIMSKIIVIYFANGKGLTTMVIQLV